jgi:hypothetical protein
LAELAAEALRENREGQYDHLVEHLAEALGPEGLRRLRQRLIAERPSAGEERGHVPSSGVKPQARMP